MTCSVVPSWKAISLLRLPCVMQVMIAVSFGESRCCGRGLTRAAGCARYFKRSQACLSQIVIQSPYWMVSNHIFRTYHGKGSHRRAASQSLELDHSERVGQAWEDEHISYRQM